MFLLCSLNMFESDLYNRKQNQSRAFKEIIRMLLKSDTSHHFSYISIRAYNFFFKSVKKYSIENEKKWINYSAITELETVFGQ